jgi:hypothetical protein
MQALPNAPVIRDTPWGLWFFGLCVCSTGVFMALSILQTGNFAGLFAGTVLCGPGLLFIVLPTVLTIRVDGESRLLIVTHRSLLTKRVKEIPLHKIDSIDVRSYGVVIIESNGRVTALRSSKRTEAWKRRMAKRLREAVGVGGSDGYFFRMLTGRDESANRQVRRCQEELTGPNNQMREAAGVHWNVQSVGMGRRPVTRWFSPDYKTNGTFVFIAQITARQSATRAMVGRLFTRGVIGKLAARASMALYGFAGDDLPDSKRAGLFELDPPLDSYFMALTPDAAVARRILNPSATAVLAEWVTRRPLRTVQIGSVEHLVVLFSPNGVYAATPHLLDESQLAELAAAGAELVKAQRQEGL